MTAAAADIELARRLERCEIPNEGFPHASHLKVAWVYLAETESVDAAADRMAAALRRFAASVGKSEKYHHTVTVFWMRVLAAARDAAPGADLDEILAAHPSLLDKTLPNAFYSPERFGSDAARASWIEPDLRPLPRLQTSDVRLQTSEQLT